MAPILKTAPDQHEVHCRHAPRAHVQPGLCPIAALRGLQARIGAGAFSRVAGRLRGIFKEFF